MFQNIRPLVAKSFDRLFASELKARIERFILILAILGFGIHLLLILLRQWGIFELISHSHSLLDNPVSAIYTPFSFILIYEVYLLIYYLPRSFSTAIGKQYEIISLIILRRIFKDIAKVETHIETWQKPENLQLFADMGGVLLTVLLIYFFYRLKGQSPSFPAPENVARFISFKKLMAILLLPILGMLSIYSLSEWIFELWEYQAGYIEEVSNINHVFYDEFFSLLILADVALLIFSLRYTERYSLLIRNAGFVVSTIIIRLSFSVEDWRNTLIILIGVLFGVLIHALYNLIGHQELDEKKTT